MKRSIISGLSALAAIAATPLHAATIIDFETTPDGTLTVPGTAVGDAYAEYGISITGASYVQCSGGCPDPSFGVFIASNEFTAPITVSFAEAINFFSFENVSDSSGRATAFAADGTQLGFVDFFGFPSQFALEFAGISTVEFTTLFQYGVDNFSFTGASAGGGGGGMDGGMGGGGGVGAIPEPSTWAMMLLGFFGVGLAVRRRERRTLAVSYS